MSGRLLAVALAAVAFSTQGRADYILEVFPSVAPNADFAASFPGYAANAVAGIAGGGVATGAAGTPEHYSAFPNGGPVSVFNMLATDFPSWKGVAPAAAPFDNEFGNRIHFGLRVRGTNGDRFALREVSYTTTDTLDGSFTDNGDYFASSYSPENVGLVRSAGGDVFVTGGANTQLVDELYLVGFGLGFNVAGVNLPDGGTTQDLNDQFGNFPEFTLAARYQLRRGELIRAATGSADVNGGAAVPAPAGLVLAGLGAAFGLVRRRFPRR